MRVTKSPFFSEALRPFSTLTILVLASACIPRTGSTVSQSPRGSGGAAIATNPPTDASDPRVALGPVETMVQDGTFGLQYFPDEGSSVLSYDPFRLVITDGLSKSSFLLRAEPGAKDPIRRLTQATKVLEPGAKGTFDNGYAGLSAVYQHAGGTYYGFYHAEDQEAMSTIPGTSIPGFYARVGLAVSKDGERWERAGYVVESHYPKRKPGGGVQWDQGAAEPSAIASHDGKYLFVYYTDHARLDAHRRGRPVLICMARAELATWPPVLPSTPGPISGFLKWRGDQFSEPALGGADTGIILPPAANSNTLEGHVAYSTTLGRYIMVYGVDAWEERTRTREAKVSGLYVAYSNDGVHWRTQREPLIRDFGVVYPGLSVSWEASILWDKGSDRAGWLVYSHTTNASHVPPSMVGRRIEFR